MTQYYINKARREELIKELIDCMEDVGDLECDDDVQAVREQLNRFNNKDFINYIKATGYGIDL